MDVVQPPPPITGKLVASFVVLLGAMALAATEEPEHHYVFVGDVVAHPTRRPVKVHGYVQAGSMLHLTSSLHRFTLTWQGACLDTELFGTLPDTVRDQSELVVDGHLEQ